MLVFTRKRNESVMIGDGVEVRVLRIGREGVRLGVTAPAEIAVHRREVYEAVRDENARAMTVRVPVGGLAALRRREATANVAD